MSITLKIVPALQKTIETLNIRQKIFWGHSLMFQDIKNRFKMLIIVHRL